MCCDRLVCAACGGRVSDAHCSTCAASRASVHEVSGNLRPELVLLLVSLALLLGLLAGV